MRMTTAIEVGLLVQVITTTKHKRLINKIDLIKNDDMWLCRAETLIKDISTSLRSLSCSERRAFIHSLRNCNVGELVKLMGGIDNVLKKRAWLRTLPGLTSDLSKADAHLDQLFFHACKLHIPKYPVRNR